MLATGIRLYLTQEVVLDTMLSFRDAVLRHAQTRKITAVRCRHSERKDLHLDLRFEHDLWEHLTNVTGTGFTLTDAFVAEIKRARDAVKAHYDAQSSPPLPTPPPLPFLSLGQQHPPLPFLSPLTPPGRRGFE